MEALVFREQGIARIERIPDPEPQADQVLVKVAATGVCHTDLDILHGRYLCAYPVVPGHEIAGTVVAKGASVQGVAVGARVAVDPLIPCGHCRACLAKRPSLCANLKGYGATTNGGFAPYMTVAAANVHSVGDLPFHVAALAEPFACVMHGIARARVRPGMRVLVFGAGPIGLMMMLGLQTRGVGDVTMVDLESSRCQRALELGAAAAVDGRDLQPEALGDGFDMVVDCTGVAEVAGRMPAFARDGATILFFGVCAPSARIALSPYEVFRRELVLIGSHAVSDNLPDSIAVLEKLGPKAEALVSHRLPLEEIARQMISPLKTGTMKIQYDAAA
ncbi:MAG TPA: zinc-dependent alcohol dehydrogenase family protein [Geminicoccus sp.]|jgi:threonine dehydrogenase-like Zn-dependent dehydrogenase|uniref:zinc-dependent alcohol dehydrogenase family protein n=1 Tax=Geminicoccus sp. TaxID=2024832 RepID=UPI002E37572D|nr:zinc-dependent alcohol dehydrogenase family protein [Geminicoccus sp.]HEX2528874.1 zinc-dependent alcohol dehydrogenase family protein [Geminicoccus sp.]